MRTTGTVAFRTLGASAVFMLSTLSAACAPDSFGPDATINLANAVAAPAVLIGAGDIAGCDVVGDEQTADLIDSLLIEHPDATVFTAGDNVYPDGTAQEYADCYEPNWGRFKDRTWAALGNHEYGTGNADASFDYFGARLGPRDLGYYSLDVGSWHLVMLNTGDRGVVPVDAGSVQEQWLRADLAAANHACVMAVIHDPLSYSCSKSGCSHGKDWVKPFWDALYEFGADIVVSGDRHHYERFALQDPDRNLDPVSGIRLFIVGTGGRGVGTPDEYPHPNVEVVNTESTNGVMKFTLYANSYDWQFVHEAGKTFTDSGSATCVGGIISDFTWTEDPLYTVAFTDASSHPSGTVVAWNWDFGDGGTDTLQHPTHTFPAVGGDYTVSLTVTGDDSTTGTTTKSVTVGPRPPVVTITAPPDGLTVTEGDLITFTGTATDAEDGDVTASLSWSSDLDGAIGSGGSVSTGTLSVGTHTITASVTDSGGLQGSATITVTVKMAGLTTMQVRVAASTDDAEEKASGSIDLTSSDLELINDRGVDQTVGMRFTGIAIPPGAFISDAYVQFQVDETPSLPTFLTIQGEATDNAVTFGTADGDISSRPRTGAAVPWDPPPWPTKGVAGMDQRTPQLAAVIQEIVDRGGWASGNALAIIVTGTGERVAEAFDGVPAAAPLLFVEFHPDPPTPPTTDAGTSTVMTSAGNVPADGTTASTITVTLSEASGAPVAGHTVSLAQGAGSSTISSPSGPSDVNGQVTFTVTNTTAEPVTYTGTDDTDGVIVTQTAQVTFGALPTDPETSTVTTSSNVPADGTTADTITVTLLDVLNAPVVGHTVSLAQDGGSSTISAPSGPSDANGQVTFTVTSTTAETVTYTGTDDTDGVTITQTADVTFDVLPTHAGISTVTTSASNVPADGTSSATITVTLLDELSAPVVGHDVNLAAGGGSSTISVPSGPSDANGQVTFTVTNTTAEPVTYTGTDDTDGVTITQTAQVTFAALPTDAGTSTVTTSVSNVPADGATAATITVTLLDGLNAPVVGHAVSLAAGGGSSTISAPSGPSDASGQVTFTATNTTAESVTYTATDDTDGVTITQPALVTFDTLPTDAGTSTVSATPSAVPADGSTVATITVTLLDALSAPLVGHSVSLVAGGGSSTVSAPSGPSDAAGQVTFTVTNSTAEAVTYTAADDTDGVPITQTASVTFDALPTDAGTSTVTATPSAVPADGTSSATITVTLVDGLNASVVGHSVSLAQGGGSSTISPASGPSDATGHVTFTVTSTTAEPVTYTATDDTDGVTITQPAQVTFAALPTDAGTSTVTATPSAVPPDGTTPATITVTLLNSVNAPVVGHVVSLAPGAGSSTISPASGPSDATGHVTFTVTNTTAESVAYTATDDTDGVVITQPAQVTFATLPTDAATSTVTTNASTVPADGTATATITVTLLNSLNDPIVGHAVSLTQGAGSSAISLPSGPSDTNGQVTFTVTNATTETVTYTATDDTDAVTITQTAEVTFDVLPTDAATSTVTTDASNVPADGTTAATIIVTLLDGLGAPVEGHSVSLVAGGGSSTVSVPSGPSDANGHVTFTVTNATAETVTYTATDDTDGVTITQTADVTFDVLPTDAGTSTITTSASNVPADGTSSASITVTLFDGLNAPVVGHSVSLAQGGGSSTISPASGPSDANGQVTFTVTNTTAGTVTYTATDDTDGVTIVNMATVTFDPLPGAIDVRVAASSDDAEELAGGSMYLNSSDLELVFDRGGNQTVGMRFMGVAIPQGASISDAFVQFQVDGASSEATSLTIEGQATDDAVTFGSVTGDVSSRPRTSAAVAWAPVPWPTRDVAGPDQRTPNLAAVIQEIVNRGGWASGNSLVLIITGTGERLAESYDGVPTAAPLLHVEFLNGPPSPPTHPGNSSLTTSASNVPADGTSSATITVTLMDGANAPVVGHSVSVAQTGSSVITGPSGSSDANGQVTFTVTNTTAEPVTYTATDVTNGVVITQTAQVTFDALPTDPGTSTVTATPSAVPPDGTTPATITVTLLNSVNVPVVGHVVGLTQGAGTSTISAASGPSDVDGQVTFSVTNATTETVTYTATDLTDGVVITQTTQVTFDALPTHPGTSTVTTSASNVPADGTTAATITVTLLDGLNAPVMGHTVSLTQGGGSSTISAPSGLSDANGQVTFTVTNTTAEAVTYTATDDTDAVTITQTAQVTFDALPTHPGTSTVSASASNVPADGTSSATITVTLLDGLNAPVAGHAVSLAQGGSSTISAPSGPSDANGQVSFTVTNTAAETVTYTATDDTDAVTVTETAQVTFDALPTDAGASTLTATPGAVPPDGTTPSTITVTLLNSVNVPVVGHVVSLTQGAGSSTISAASGSSDANGQVTFLVTNTTAETVTYTATDDTDGVLITQTAVVTFDAAPSVIEVRVAASSDDAEERADGRMYIISSDLEMVYDGGGDQKVGMRFTGVAIPQGASISNAYVQFQVDETPSGSASLTIEGEATADALKFSRTDGDISARPRTNAVPWTPAAWPTVGAAGMDQRTPDLAAVIQEIVNQGGWASGNALVIIISGTGERVAEAYDGDPAAAPLLHVEYSN